MRRLLSLSALIVLTGSVPGNVPELCAQTLFGEIGFQRGLSFYLMPAGQGAGLSAIDIDDDGDIDLFVPTAAGLPHRCYINQGDGNFVDEASDLGLALTEPHRGGLWFDYNSDGRLDVVLFRDSCDPCDDVSLMRLFEQLPSGEFVERTEEANLEDQLGSFDGMHVGGFAAGDFNNDSAIDFYVAYWAGEARLFLNNSDGSFTASSFAGFDPIREHWQPLLHDFNGDGWLDIYQAIDFTSNLLWLSDGTGGFTEVAAATGADNAMNDMGATLGDFDNDGDFDLYVTNVTRFDDHNILLRNDTTGGVLTFTEVATAENCELGGWGWGVTFFDANRDGRLDIFATNGAPGMWADDVSRYYENLGATPFFSDQAPAAGLDDTFWGSGAVAADFDADGDLDLSQVCGLGGPHRLLDNQTVNDHHWLRIRPRRPAGNTHSLGAIVAVTQANLTQIRRISAGTSFLSQEPAEAFFGFETDEPATLVEIQWPDGTTVTLTAVALDQTLTVLPASPDFRRGDPNADSNLNIADAIAILEDLFSGGDSILCDEAADTNDDGQLDVADSVYLLTYLFANGPNLPEPNLCGEDPTLDSLTCSISDCP